MSEDLSIETNGLRFENPFIVASGPPSSNARVIAKAFDAGFGGAVCKTVTLTDTQVINVVPRYSKYHSPNKEVIGFENIELVSDRSFEDWEEDYRILKKKYPHKILIASLMESYDKSRWKELAERSVKAGCDALELNFSCPHGHTETGMGAAMGKNADQIREVTKWVVDAVDVPVWAKMTSDTNDITLMAKASKEGGASGISAINTILAITGINLKNLRPVPTVEGYSVPGGYSYLGIKPIALRIVHDIALALPKTHISGIGGISQSRDAIEYILLGASTVQMCTSLMLQGLDIVKKMKEDLSHFLKEHNFNSLSDAVGASLQYFVTYEELVDMQEIRRRKKIESRASKDGFWGTKDYLQEETDELTSKL